VSEYVTEGATLNPWRSLWTQPRATIQQLVASDPSKHVLLITAIVGVSNTLSQASQRNLGDRTGLGSILAIAFILGPLFAIAMLYLFAAVLRRTGRWFGGQASSRDLRASTAWSSVPVAVAAVLWIPQLALVGREMFSAESPTLSASVPIALAMLGLHVLEIVAAVWAIVLFFKCLSQVQQFSVWKALGNAVLAALAVVVSLIAIGGVIVAMGR
jgi:hypothetical protein